MDPEKSQSSNRHAPLKILIILAAGLALFGWLLNTPAGILGKADAIGYAVCHRIAVRSFFMGERQLPLCARCTGMYLGAMLGLGYQVLIEKRRSGMPGKSRLMVFAVLAAAFGVDGINSYLHFFPGIPTLYEPQNWLRLLTGTGMGLVMAAAVFLAFNQTVWSDWDPRSTFENWSSLLVLIFLALVLDGLVWMQNALILYPLALISAAGVLVLLTMIYSMVGLMVFRLENRYQKIQQLFLPLTAGFTFSILQIAAFDLVRYWLTGTWEGFHLG